MFKILENVVSQIAQNHQLTLKVNLNDNILILYHSKFKHFIDIIIKYNCDENNFSVATAIGAEKGGSDYNRGLFERLRSNSNEKDIIENFYKDCNFVSNIRLNTFKTNIWFTAETFNSLDNYLKMFDKIKITRSRIPKQTCIDDLNERCAKGQFKRIQKYSYKSYHWLEFLTISETFDATPLTNGDIDTIEKILDSAIEKHLKGMFFIKKIRQIRIRRS